jgi:ferritin
MRVYHRISTVIAMPALSLAVASALTLSTAGHGATDTAMVRKLPPEVTSAFNQQIKDELNGAQEYLRLASHFYGINLNGFGSWYTAQYVEELNHARMMMFFLTDKDETPIIAGIDVPTINFTTPLDAASSSLNLEEIQTERIYKLHDLATSMNSRDAATFMLFFITEQVQEEANFKNQVDKLTLAGDDRAALLALDKDAGARLIPPFFMPPPAL